MVSFFVSFLFVSCFFFFITFNICIIGFLPADQIGALGYYLALSIIYLIIGLIWLGICMVYKYDLLAIQGWISLVILLGMIETALAFFDLNQWNQDGLRSYGTLGACVFFGACKVCLFISMFVCFSSSSIAFDYGYNISKRAISRVLILLVSLGYGMLKPSLGPLLYQVLLLGTVYFLVSLACKLCFFFILFYDDHYVISSLPPSYMYIYLYFT